MLEETPTYRLSGKTGWGGLGERTAPQTGWLVGYLERDADVYFFATNIDIEGKEDADARFAITKAVLRDLELIEENQTRRRLISNLARNMARHTSRCTGLGLPKAAILNCSGLRAPPVGELHFERPRHPQHWRQIE